MKYSRIQIELDHFNITLRKFSVLEEIILKKLLNELHFYTLLVGFRLKHNNRKMLINENIRIRSSRNI